MGLFTAFRAFWKALFHKKEAELFLSGRQETSASTKKKEGQEGEHLRLLTLLQQKGRLIDFFQEDISECTDAQLGAVTREVHASCAEALEELITVRPIFSDGEGTEIHIPKGYDPSKIKVVGNVRGEGPYIGHLVHPGWEAKKRSLPKQVGQGASDVLCPAEVEVS